MGFRVHLVDGTYELFRAFYGAPKVTAPDGREVGATRGILRTLLALVKNEGATHVAIAFDHVIESFRNELYAGYKTGEGIDPDLRGQFELAEEASAALGFVVWPMVEFEADDALAAAAHRYAEDPEVDQVLICSPDKDLMQCVRGARVVAVDRRRKIVLDEAGVTAKFGVPPKSIPDFLALVGDAADGYPGLPRFGEKTAAALLAVHGRVEDIPEGARAWGAKVRGAGELAEILRARRDELALYKRLATLRVDVPIAEDARALTWRGPDLARLEPLLERLGDSSFLPQVAAVIIRP